MSPRDASELARMTVAMRSGKDVKPRLTSKHARTVELALRGQRAPAWARDVAAALRKWADSRSQS